MPEHPLNQRHQRERASFAVIVHSHDEQHIFQGHYYRSAQITSETTPNTISGIKVAPSAAAFRLSLARRADWCRFAVDNADGAERKGPERRALGVRRARNGAR